MKKSRTTRKKSLGQVLSELLYAGIGDLWRVLCLHHLELFQPLQMDEIGIGYSRAAGWLL